MNPPAILRLGDTVSYNDSWGRGPRKEGRVEHIELVTPAGSDEPEIYVPAIFWDSLKDRRVAVIFESTPEGGKWAYGFQLVQPAPAPHTEPLPDAHELAEFDRRDRNGARCNL